MRILCYRSVGSEYARFDALSVPFSGYNNYEMRNVYEGCIRRARESEGERGGGQRECHIANKISITRGYHTPAIEHCPAPMKNKYFNVGDPRHRLTVRLAPFPRISQTNYK